MKNNLKNIIKSANRYEMWARFINQNKLTHIAEVGVYRGDFAKYILANCPIVKKYYMIDPWRPLANWNKPANHDKTKFESFYKETLEKTEFAKEKRVILNAKTTEIINKINDHSLDFAYIDADHTLKGITIDLISFWDKVKRTGVIVGDDFNNNLFHHGLDFEPTLVFPFALYFAEAKNKKIYGMPYSQFMITKEFNGFEFINMSGNDYSNTSLLYLMKINFQKRKYNNLLTKLGRLLRRIY